MEYRKLGNSGAVVSALCLGTMTFGAEADEATSHRIIDDYVAAGGNFIDTADVYSAGASETIVGRWLAAHPTEAAQMVVATKGRFPMGPGPNDIGISRRHLTQALEASLKRLGIEQIDLYQMHAWDALTPLEETLALPRRRDQRRQDRLLRLLELPRLARHQGGASGQGPRLGGAGDAAAAIQSAGARHRARDRAGLPRRRDRPAALVAAWPAAGSRASTSATWCRPARPGSARTPSAAWRPTRPRNAQERTWSIIDAVAGVAKARGVSPAEVALAWVAAQPAVTSVILGARTPEQLADNLKSADLTLTPKEIAGLSELSAPVIADYPYGKGGVAQRHRKLEGGR